MGTVNLQRLSGRYSQNETFCGTFLCLVSSVRGPYPSPPWSISLCCWSLRHWCCDPQQWPCPLHRRCSGPWSHLHPPACPHHHQAGPLRTEQLCFWIQHQDPQACHPSSPIQVPTVLKGTHTVLAPIIDEQVEIHNVQTPVLVERPVNIPYDAPFYSDNLVQVPVPVHVDAPYNAPFPVPVQGEPIIKKSVAPAVVTHSNHVAHAGITHVSQTAPIVNAAAYAAAPAAAYVH